MKIIQDPEGFSEDETCLIADRSEKRHARGECGACDSEWGRDDEADDADLGWNQPRELEAIKSIVNRLLEDAREGCTRCDSTLTGGYCDEESCPFHDHLQTCPAGNPALRADCNCHKDWNGGLGKKRTFGRADVGESRRFTEGVDYQLARDILSTAAEGGINYWADQMKGVQFPTKIHDSEEDKWYDLTREQFNKGVQMFLQKGNRSAGAGTPLEDDFDAGDADQIIQFALFGEVVYG